MTSRFAIPCLCLVAACMPEEPTDAEIGALAEECRAPRPPRCDPAPTGVETQDYFLSYVVPQGVMGDSTLAGRRARISVHRIRPVYAHGKCPSVPARAAVMVHGRTAPAQTSFDYRSGEDRTGEFSFQEALARAGIDTFAPNLTGYGPSSRFGLDDPCNASLPGFDSAGNCANPAIGCDRSINQGIFPLNRQPDLATNPRDGQGLCAHSSPYYFATADLWVRDIRQVIDDAIDRADLGRRGKVTLIGYSFGSQRVGRALDPTRNPDIARKVDRAVFMSSLFYQGVLPPGTPASIPQPEDPDPNTTYYTFPLHLSGKPAPAGGGFTMAAAAEASCTGHIPPNANAESWQQQMELDPILGAQWGGTDPNAPTGVLRSPTFPSHGLNRTVAGRITTPTLVLAGLEDTGVPPPSLAHSCGLFDSLTSSPSKVFVQIGCGSHSMQFETCTGDRCCNGHACDPVHPVCEQMPYDGTCPWAGPHTTVSKAVIDWIRDGTFDGQTPGPGGSRYSVDPSGRLQPGVTTCPAVLP